MGPLLDEFAPVRSANPRELRALIKLGHEDLELRGRHPALGVGTLSELRATWAAHDLRHLHQISRAVAHQYRGRGSVARVLWGAAVRRPHLLVTNLFGSSTTGEQTRAAVADVVVDT
jgi:hypothetical protein